MLRLPLPPYFTLKYKSCHKTDMFTIYYSNFTDAEIAELSAILAHLPRELVAVVLSYIHQWVSLELQSWSRGKTRVIQFTSTLPNGRALKSHLCEICNYNGVLPFQISIPHLCCDYIHQYLLLDFQVERRLKLKPLLYKQYVAMSRRGEL